MTKSQIFKYSAILLIGNAISLFVFFSINSSRQLKNKSIIDNAVAKSGVKLEEELNKISLVIESMGFFFESTEQVSQALFERFTNPFLQQLKGIGAMEWAPKVEDIDEGDFERFTIITKTDSSNNFIVSQSRGTHYPIKLLNPLEPLKEALGYDLYSSPVRKSAIDSATRSKKLALTGPIELVRGNNGVPGILALKSVNDTTSNEVKGIVAGIYRMDTFIENTLNEELSVLDLCIHDETADNSILFSSVAEKEIEKFDEKVIGMRFRAANRFWSIHFLPKPEYLSFPHVVESYAILLLGILSTILLTDFIRKRDSYNERLEARVLLRTAELEKSNKLKENLLREIHHRVKNNLQITSSLMNMQKRKLRSKEAITALEDSQSRISAIALTHQKIYQEKDSKAVNLKEYLNDLMEYEKKISSSFSYKINCPEISIDLDRAVPLALIISELTINAVKHAYPDTTKYNELLINVERLSNEEVSLTILDNGKGLPEDFDIENAEGIGFEIIRALCRQISAKLAYESSDNGTQFTLVFAHEVYEEAPVFS